MIVITLKSSYLDIIKIQTQMFLSLHLHTSLSYLVVYYSFEVIRFGMMLNSFPVPFRDLFRSQKIGGTGNGGT